MLSPRLLFVLVISAAVAAFAAGASARRERAQPAAALPTPVQLAPGDYINAEMVKGFITSIEYTKRFGQP